MKTTIALAGVLLCSSFSNAATIVEDSAGGGASALGGIGYPGATHSAVTEPFGLAAMDGLSLAQSRLSATYFGDSVSLSAATEAVPSMRAALPLAYAYEDLSLKITLSDPAVFTISGTASAGGQAGGLIGLGSTVGTSDIAHWDINAGQINDSVSLDAGQYWFTARGNAGQSSTGATNLDLTVGTVAVPEPSSFVIGAFGMLGFAAFAKRLRRNRVSA